MDREPPPVTVTAPGSAPRPPDLLEAEPRRPRRWWPVVALALAPVALAVAVRSGAPERPPGLPHAAPLPRTGTSGMVATASLAGAATDGAFDQRLTLTVDLPPYDGRGDSGGRLLGDEVVLVGVRVRGFTVELDSAAAPVPLGRFGRSYEVRSTTVPVTAAVGDCSVEAQAPRDILLTVRTGDGPDGTVRTATTPDVVRALDRLVARACRRPRG